MNRSWRYAGLLCAWAGLALSLSCARHSGRQVIANGPPASAPVTESVTETVTDAAGVEADVRALRLAGPTSLSRVEGGYALSNRHVRMVVNGNDGRVIYWGSADGKSNVLGPRGIQPGLKGLPAAAPTGGYVESRDEETWQFIGEDSNHIRWRNLYCLHGDALYVTCLVESMGEQPLETSLQLWGDWKQMQVVRRDRDSFEGHTPLGEVSLRIFNERHEAAAEEHQPAGAAERAVLESDSLRLGGKYGRLSYTMEWRWQPPDTGK